MKFFLFLLNLFVLSIAIEIDSQEYKELSALEKRNELWKKIKQEGTVGWLSKLKVLGLFFSDMKPSMKHYGDQMPAGRTKFIHSFGVVGKMEITSTNDHDYTGIFQGCKNVIGRFSLPVAYEKGNLKKEGAGKNNFVPAIAIKCLLDRSTRSSNLHAMYGVDGGQESWNFFKNDLSNHIAEHISKLKLRLVASKFSTAAPFFATLGLSQAASVSTDSKNKTPLVPVFPFELIFKPNPVLQKKFPDDFKESFDVQLGSIEPGTVLYELWAKKEKESEPKKIGELKLVEENMVHSEYADKSLFFQHGDWMKDLKYKPEWEKLRSTYTQVYGEAIIQKMQNAVDFDFKNYIYSHFKKPLQVDEDNDADSETSLDPAMGDKKRKKRKLKSSKS